MNNKISLSASRVSDFVKCPYMFQQKHVLPKAMRVPFQQSPAMLEGELCHRALELRVGCNQPLPPKYLKHEPMAVQIASAPGQTFTELDLAVDWNMQPCGSKEWDRVAWRVKIDIAKLNGASAWAGDYKTGTPTFDGFQLRLTAAAMYRNFPDVTDITTSYIWLKTGRLDPSDSAHYSRAKDEYNLWQEMNAVSQAVQDMNEVGVWTPKPDKRKCGWCDVNKHGRCPSAAAAYTGS